MVDPPVSVGWRFHYTKKTNHAIHEGTNGLPDKVATWVNIEDAVTATRKQIEDAGFTLKYSPTGPDINHHTLQLPKPVTPEAVDTFNKVFGKKTMELTLEAILSAVPISQWQIQSIIIVDWYDGPLEGICVLQHPVCIFYFKIIGAKYRPDDVDDRIFQISDFPGLTEAQSKDIIACGPQAFSHYSDVFTPETESKIISIIESKGKPVLIVRTADWISFEEMWRFIPSDRSY